jgi:hypothetical protein
MSELLYPAILKQTSQIITFPPLFIKLVNCLLKDQVLENDEDV